MKNLKGDLLTSKENILKEAENHNIEAFEERSINPENEGFKKEREKLALKRLE